MSDEPQLERDFSGWVQQHFDLVYSAALRQLGGDAHGARDAAQLVFLAAARKREALARHPSPVGWLYTATHFAVKKMIRQDSNRRCRERTAAELEEAAREETDWTAVRPHLDAALLALGSREREALLLRFFDQRSYAEVGARLSLSENAARMRVDRALDKLRRNLVRRGVVSSAAALSAGLATNAVAAAPVGMGAAVAAAVTAEGAAAAGGGAGAAFAFHLMATKLTVGLAAAAGLLAGSGVYLAFQARAEAAAAGRLDGESARWESALQETTGREAREQSRLGALPLPAAPAPAGKPASSLAAAQALLNQEIAENPQLRAKLGQMLLATFRLEYGPLARTLGLSPDQFDRLVALNLKLESDVFDATQAARLAGVDSDSDAGLHLLKQQARDEYAAGVRAAFGETDAAQILDFDRMQGAHQLASEVAAAAAYAGTPLSSSDADRLARGLAEASPDYRQGGIFDAQSVNWDQFMDQAGGPLPPAVRQALRARRAASAIDAMEDSASGGGQEAAP